MNEISLHILDVIQNSIKANATLITVTLDYNNQTGMLIVKIEDNGCGMDEAFVANVCNPFITTRTTRKVGFGLSLFKVSAEGTGGSFNVTSKKGFGTCVTASFNTKHPDCPPMGDMTGTILSQVVCSPNIDFNYHVITTDGEMNFDTRQIRQVLGKEISLAEPEVIRWMTENINEELNEIGGGTIV